MPIFVTGHRRAGKRVKGYTRQSLVQAYKGSVRASAADRPYLAEKLRKKYLEGYRRLHSGRGYDPTRFINRTVRRALGKKVSLYR